MSDTITRVQYAGTASQPIRAKNDSSTCTILVIDNDNETVVSGRSSYTDLRALVGEETLREMLEVVMYAFSLNRSSLASALRISRPTAYAWLSSEEDLKDRMDAGNLGRLKKLYTLAVYWMKLAKRPMRENIRNTGTKWFGASFTEILESEQLDSGRAIDLMEFLRYIDHSDGKRPSIADRMKAKGRSPKSGAAEIRDMNSKF